MKHWFQDSLLRSVMRNAGYLGSGKIAAVLLGLVSLACAGRGLTPALFGTLMVVHTYATGAGAITKFQTWQFIIRYASPALVRDDRDHARDVIRFAFGLDLASGLVGMIGAVAILPLVADRLGLGDHRLMAIALLYCTLVPTMTAATPVGVLRLLDRFDLLGAQQAVTPILRGAGAAIAYFGHLGFAGFVAAWYVADLAGDATTWAFAIRELRRRGMLDALRPGLFGVGRTLPNAWGFVWTTNIAHSVYAAWGPFGNLVVATVLGPAAAGLFKIADTLVSSTGKPADLLSRGFYPEIMRLDPRSRAPWRLGLRMASLSALAGLGFVLLLMVGGRPLIGAIFGQSYLAAFSIVQVMTWSLVISTAVFPLEPLLYMVDRQRTALVAQLAAAGAYLLLLYGLTHRLGLIGAGYAYLVGTVLGAAFLLAPTLRSYRDRRLLPAPARVAAV